VTVRRQLLLAVAACLLVAGCGYADPGTTASNGGVAGTDVPTPTPSPSPIVSSSPGADDFNAGKGLPVVTLPDGLKYIDLVAGTGAQPAKGDTISVQYTGWLSTGGAPFDSSRSSGTPATFQIGVGAVIPGWDEAVITMKVGGKRKLILPPDLGYGAQGQPPAIPPNSTLVFAVELLSTAPTPSPSPSASP
jgi:peptidylprolyl isomerase